MCFPPAVRVSLLLHPKEHMYVTSTTYFVRCFTDLPSPIPKGLVPALCHILLFLWSKQVCNLLSLPFWRAVSTLMH